MEIWTTLSVFDTASGCVCELQSKDAIHKTSLNHNFPAWINKVFLSWRSGDVTLESYIVHNCWTLPIEMLNILEHLCQ